MLLTSLKLVRREGLEPSYLSVGDFESPVYTIPPLAAFISCDDLVMVQVMTPSSCHRPIGRYDHSRFNAPALLRLDERS